MAAARVLRIEAIFLNLTDIEDRLFAVGQNRHIGIRKTIEMGRDGAI